MEKKNNLLTNLDRVKFLSNFKPLSFFDVETTGIDPTSDRIVEISIYRMDKGEITTYDALIDPIIPIPSQASDVHGITKEILSKFEAKPFSEHADHICRMLKDTVLVTFNGDNFDVPLIMTEFSRSNISFTKADFETLDVRTIYVKMNGRQLSDAFLNYVGEEMEEAHKASSDVEATISILERQLDVHDMGELSLREVIDFSKYEDPNGKSAIYPDYKKCFVIKDGIAYMNMGKNKGLPALNDRSYLIYIATNRKKDNTFTYMQDTRDFAQKLLDSGKR